MIKIHKNLILVLLIIFGFSALCAQEIEIRENETKNSEIIYQLRAGLNLGGFSPIPLPEEIRKIEGFDPKLNFNMEGNATYWFLVNNIAWGFRAGICLENKGMETQAKVKNYGIKLLAKMSIVC